MIFALRTGPGDFNRLLVTSVETGAACPPDGRLRQGRVWDVGGEEQALPTPEEDDYFGVLDVPC